MAHMILRDIESYFTKLAERERTLPGYWGEPSTGILLFGYAIDLAKRYETERPGTRIAQFAMDVARRYARLAKHVLDEAKKKPKQAFESFNVTAIAFDRRIKETTDFDELDIEEAFQWAQKKSSSLIHAAKSDSKHWLRETVVWKKLYARPALV